MTQSKSGVMTCLYIIGYVLVDEVIYFYTHWACHKSTFLYQNVHKQHHLHSVRVWNILKFARGLKTRQSSICASNRLCPLVRASCCEYFTPLCRVFSHWWWSFYIFSMAYSGKVEFLPKMFWKNVSDFGKIVLGGQNNHR